MPAEEVVYLTCPFAGQKRTDSINQTPARPHELGADFEQPLLARYEFIEPFRSQSPAPLRITPPGPAARTRCIYENKVGRRSPFREFLRLVRRVHQANEPQELAEWRASADL